VAKKTAKPDGADLYIVQSGVTGAIKIGRSKHPKKRLEQLQTGCPYPLRLILVLENQGHIERDLHKRLERGKTRGGEEWFDYDVLPELPDDIYWQMDIEMVDSWWQT